MRVFLFLVSTALLAQVPTSRPRPAASGTQRSAAKPATASPAANPAQMTDEEKTIYALGASVGRNFANFGFTPAEMAVFAQGLRDGASGKPALDLAAWQPKI